MPRRAPEAAVTERRDLSETTPIFEEIASAWFQSNRPVPVDWETTEDESEAGQPDTQAGIPTLEPQAEPVQDEVDSGQETPREPQAAQAPPMLDPRLRVTSSLRSYAPGPPAQDSDAPAEQQPAPEPERAPEVAQAPQAEAVDAPVERPEPAAEYEAEPEPVEQRHSEPEPQPVEQQSEPEPEVAEQPEPEPVPPAPQRVMQQQPARPAVQQPAAPPPRVEPEPAHAVSEPAAMAPSSMEFASAADAGWQAAQAMQEGSGDEPEELTSAGLPKRRPRARLIPGSASAAVSPTQENAPPRTADAVRGRLASYQEGVRQGREQRLRRGPDPAGATTGGRPSEGHDEENR